MTVQCKTSCDVAPESSQEEALWEYLTSDVFWLLAIAIVINAFWVNRQVDLFDELSNDNKKSENAAKEGDKALNEPLSGNSPKSTASLNRYKYWLQPHLTSRFRQYFAMFLCSLVIPVQLLHGTWVVLTTWRLTVAILKSTYPQIKPRLLGFLLYSPLTAVLLFAWAIVLGTGVFLVILQLLYVLKLRELKPGANIDSIESDETSKQSDGEWDRVENEEGKSEDGEKQNRKGQ
ncbi:hypothetical protein FDECE_10432 [Fusarium decemcellulare]|nr:hypothetical protein FDECE_10432 [Fusarium decemcellulare]